MIYRDDLQRVYALIERPEAWTQGSYAKDAFGYEVWHGSPDACMWCLRGAFLRVDATKFGRGISDCLLVGSVVVFNDAEGRKHSEVLALLQSAIDRAPVRA